MLTSAMQDILLYQIVWYISQYHRLNMNKLMGAFQQFFQEHFGNRLERFELK
jgi:hypothetical protein